MRFDLHTALAQALLALCQTGSWRAPYGLGYAPYAFARAAGEPPMRARRIALRCRRVARQWRKRGQEPTPGEVEQAVKDILADR